MSLVTLQAQRDPDRRTRIYAVLVGGVPIGTARLSAITRRGDAIASISIDDDHQRQGYGTAALDALLTDAFTALHIRQITGQCLETDPAIGFWQAQAARLVYTHPEVHACGREWRQTAEGLVFAWDWHARPIDPDTHARVHPVVSAVPAEANQPLQRPRLSRGLLSGTSQATLAPHHQVQFIEGQASHLDLALLVDGVPFNGIGLALGLLVRTKANARVPFTGQVRWVQPRGGVVRVVVPADQFRAAQSPYSVRLTLTDLEGHERVVPTGEPDVWLVRT